MKIKLIPMLFALLASPSLAFANSSDENIANYQSQMSGSNWQGYTSSQNIEFLSPLSFRGLVGHEIAIGQKFEVPGQLDYVVSQEKDFGINVFILYVEERYQPATFSFISQETIDEEVTVDFAQTQAMKEKFERDYTLQSRILYEITPFNDQFALNLYTSHTATLIPEIHKELL